MKKLQLLAITMLLSAPFAITYTSSDAATRQFNSETRHFA